MEFALQNVTSTERVEWILNHVWLYVYIMSTCFGKNVRQELVIANMCRQTGSIILKQVRHQYEGPQNPDNPSASTCLKIKHIRNGVLAIGQRVLKAYCGKS